VHAHPRPQAGRLVALALVGIIAAGACSSLAVDGLAGVPGTPRVDQGLTEVTSTPTPTPRAKPRPTPSPVAEARVDGGSKRTRPKVTTIRLAPRPKPGPFQMNLFRKGDFMHQVDKNACVAGSTQTMMNIIDPGKPNRSIAFQKRLYQRGRELSPNKAKLGPIGIDVIGWAELLNTNGYGPYVVDSAATRRGAIRKAAKALRLTNKPVGLVTWRGAHSWVMSGFTATADPAYSDDFQVLKVNIQDTWYPYVSTIWGASRPPDALVPVAALAEDYLPYARPRARYPKRDGRFMLILPQLPPRTVAR
jgi:hypothetical protein